MVESRISTPSVGLDRLILSAVADTNGRTCCPTDLVDRLGPTLLVGNSSRHSRSVEDDVPIGFPSDNRPADPKSSIRLIARGD